MSSTDRPNLDAQLDASLRRIRQALDQNRGSYAPLVQEILLATGAHVVDRISAKIAEDASWRSAHWRRRAERRALRRARREREALATAKPKGVVLAGAALVCLVFAVLNPVELWWLIFVAFGFSMAAASKLSRASARASAKRASGTASEPQPAGANGVVTAGDPPDPKVERIQSLCDRLLAEVQSGPAVFRDVIKSPKETIEGLRQACLAISKRERELRDALAAQDEARLSDERRTLAERLTTEKDELVRRSLESALRALDEQRAHRAEVATAASRLDAENTRILYTLESLHMQILRARSTETGAPELGGKLRRGLEDLTHEIDAVAEALEWVQAPPGAARSTSAAGEPARPAGRNQQGQGR